LMQQAGMTLQPTPAGSVDSPAPAPEPMLESHPSLEQDRSGITSHLVSEAGLESAPQDGEA
jgi:hypothetical protein